MISSLSLSDDGLCQKYRKVWMLMINLLLFPVELSESNTLLQLKIISLIDFMSVKNNPFSFYGSPKSHHQISCFVWSAARNTQIFLIFSRCLTLRFFMLLESCLFVLLLTVCFWEEFSPAGTWTHNFIWSHHTHTEHIHIIMTAVTAAQVLFTYHFYTHCKLL